MEEKERKSYPSDLTDEQREEIAPLYTGMRNCTWSKRELTEGKTQGRKRYIVVDVLGCLWSAVVHAANIHDTKGGISTAERACMRYPSIQKLCADAGYRGTFVSNLKEQLDLDISEKIKPHQWEKLPWRWVVECTLSWLNHSRRLSKIMRFLSLPLRLWS